MAVNLSIKNVPEKLADRLRERASRAHRSLQGELMSILELATSKEQSALSADDLIAAIRDLGLKTRREAVRMIRADRSGR